MTTRIMVVDDEPLICQLLMHQLSGAGYMVSIAQSGREALQRLLVDQPDLLLLDVMMQDMSGWDLCRQVRSYSNVPIILLTARGADDDVVTGLNAGADDYVTKPFRLAQLLARIEAVLRRNSLTLQSQNGPAVMDTVSLPAKAVAVNGTQPGGQRSSSPSLHRPARPLDVQTRALPVTPVASSIAQQHSHVETSNDAHVQKADQWAAQTRLGQSFSMARKKRGLTLHQAERLCGVRWEFLQAIELEHFDYMPRAQLRQALKSYSTLLNLDLQQLTGQKPDPQPRRWVVIVGFAAIMVILLVIMSLLFL